MLPLAGVLVAYARNVRIHWLEAERVLVKTCDGFVPSDALRRTYDEVVRFVERHRVTRILSDNRGLVPAAGEDLGWIERDWLPRALDAGWRHWALLPPTTPLGAMHIKRWIDIYGARGIAIRVCADVGEALAWLREQPDEAGSAGAGPG